jgi:hypothetical protein
VTGTLDSLLVACEPFPHSVVDPLGALHHLPDIERRRPALHRDAIEESPGKRLSCRRARVVPGDHANTVQLGEAFEAGRHVDGITHHRVFQTAPRAEVAHHHPPRIDADAEVHVIPAPRLELRADGPQGQAHVERGLAGAPGVVGLVHGRIPERLDGIPGELHDHAVVGEHDVAHDGAISG